MNAIEKLREQFEKFPGIGPRQARRFVYYLLTRNPRMLEDLSRLITELKNEIVSCSSCYRFFAKNHGSNALCSICRDQNRETEKLMLVEKDADLDNIEKSGVFKGRYFVLGGSIPILEKHPERLVRTRELTSRLEDLKKAKESPREIIFAFSNTPEGDSTAQFLIELLSPLADVQGFTFTTLGRGLSTGSELEYSDTETIKSAFQNRA